MSQPVSPRGLDGDVDMQTGSPPLDEADDDVGGLYVSTVQHSTAVHHAVLTRVLRSDCEHLVLSQNTVLHVYTLHRNPTRLALETTVPLLDQIVAMVRIPPANDAQDGTDRLFIVTQRLRFVLLEWRAGAAAAVARGSLADRLGKPSEVGIVALFDPRQQLLAVHAYEGQVRIIPLAALEGAGDMTASPGFVALLDELTPLSFAFLEGHSSACLGILYEDVLQKRHLATYLIDQRLRELVPGPLRASNLELGAALLLAAPATLGGALVIGESTASHVQSGDAAPKTLDFGRATSIRCATPLAGNGATGFLLGDYLGRLYLLQMQLGTSGARLNGMHVAELGETTAAWCLTHLGGDLVFVGSHYGDSQVLRLLRGDAEPGVPLIEEVAALPSLAPITDFVCVQDSDYGHTQLVTCSNACKEGTLRTVQSELSVHELSRGEVAGMTGLWAVSARLGAHGQSNMLAVGFAHETRFLGLVDDETFCELETPPLVARERSLLVANVPQLVQVTPTQVVAVVDAAAGRVETWRPPQDARIVAAAALADCGSIVVALAHPLASGASSSLLVTLALSVKLVEVARRELPAEVGCLHAAQTAANEKLLAVGCWGETLVRLLRVETLREVAQASFAGLEAADGVATVRSVRLARLAKTWYLFVGLADGNLQSFELFLRGEISLRPAARRPRRIGQRPVTLCALETAGKERVLALSDLAVVVEPRNGRLRFNPVDLARIVAAAPLQTAGCPDGVAFATEEALVLGVLDDTRRVHIRTTCLEECEFARRLAFDADANVLAVATLRVSAAAADGTPASERNELKLFDRAHLESGRATDTYSFSGEESVEAVLQFAPGVFVVGTAISPPGSEEPTRGCVLVFRASARRQLQQLCVHHLSAPVYALASTAPGRLVVAAGTEVQLFRVNVGEDAAVLELADSFHGQVLSLLLAATGAGQIAVGDMIKSVTLLRHDFATDTLEEVARDHHTNWLTALEFATDGRIVAAEHMFNLFALEAAGSGELETSAAFHLADQVNRFRRGSMVSRAAAQQASARPVLLFATLNGRIGALSVLSTARFRQVDEVYRVFCDFVSLRKTPYAFASPLEARKFANERRALPAVGAIDGDLLQHVLSWPKSEQGAFAAHLAQLAKPSLPGTTRELVQFLEDLSILH